MSDNNYLTLNKSQILEYQKNRPPYLMIDEATEVIPGLSAKGFKYLNENEWFFEVHWEGDPNMPGMLQIEALVQMSALSILTLPGNKGKVMYLVNANNLKFFKKFFLEVNILLKLSLKVIKEALLYVKVKLT